MKNPLACLILVVYLVANHSGHAAHPLQLSNARFEEPQLPRGGRDPAVPGWRLAINQSGESGIVRDDLVNVNASKHGAQWLQLQIGDAIGQPLTDFFTIAGQRADVDRVFVAFTLSSLQEPTLSNSVDLSVELIVSRSNQSWRDGRVLASKNIRELTNDVRGDLNSYVDAFAILVFNRDELGLNRPSNDLEAQDATAWLVVTNTSQSRVMATLDNVQVNLAGPPPLHKDLPNIVVVFQDDMGYGDASCMNPDSKIRTPNLDRLAAQGLLFRDAHSAATICGPSRIGLLTGTVPDKLGVHDNFAAGGNERLGPPTLPANTPTLATLCKNAGYHTAIMGKWGIPSNWDARLREGVTERLSYDNAAEIVDFSKPLENAEGCGFDYRYIFDESRPFLVGETESFEGNPQPFGWHENGFAVRDILTHTQDELHEYYLRAITDRAVRYIQTQAGLRAPDEHDFRLSTTSQFYLHYLTHAPHLPIVPAKQFLGSSQAGAYGDFVVDLDYSLGRLMNALDEAGLGEDTMIVFSADNGPEHFAYQRAQSLQHYSMGQLRGVKRDLYEGGHRVPLVVRWPAVISPARESSALVSLTDWYATFAAITQQVPADDTGLDSMNLLPILTGDATQMRPLMLQDTAVGPNWRGIRFGSWMFMESESGELNRGREPAWFQVLREVRDVPGPELYNLESDLGQSTNRGLEESELLDKLSRLSSQLWAPNIRSTPPYSAQGDSDHDGYSDFYEEMLGAL
jgi:arylsulfatase A